MLVRSADVDDAEEVASVLRRSVRDLCVLDHAGDEHALQQWLGNKTPENVRSWIEAADRYIVLAEENGSVLGVGGASHGGEIILNYVAPDARFKGVSKSILGSLEAYLRGLGLARSTLTSTRTAHRFYLAMGYEDVGDPELWRELAGQPMRKSLQWPDNP
jgi:GNAT superfamily N-acetyltransferase